MCMPTVSVIIPVYNGRKYLGETLESVLNQTAPAAEIIVIDDGSTDGSGDLARSFGAAVQVISRSNQGISAARNFGASLSTSQWFAFLDADDLWGSENLARQTAEIAAHPGADLSYCGRMILRVAPGAASFTSEISRPMPTPAELDGVLMDRCPFTPCSAIIKRESFFAAGGWNSRFDGAEDWNLWLRMSALGARYVYCPEYLVRYRIHDGSISQNALETLTVMLRVIEETIFPRMTSFERATKGRKLKSRVEAEASIAMYERKTSWAPCNDGNVHPAAPISHARAL